MRGYCDDKVAGGGEIGGLFEGDGVVGDLTVFIAVSIDIDSEALSRSIGSGWDSSVGSFNEVILRTVGIDGESEDISGSIWIGGYCL